MRKNGAQFLAYLKGISHVVTRVVIDVTKNGNTGRKWSADPNRAIK
jgi:hypothetical protein